MVRQEVLAHGQWILPPHGQQIHGALGTKAQGGAELAAKWSGIKHGDC